jgi:hypothetical protein
MRDPITGWAKLNRDCHCCKQQYADIEFTMLDCSPELGRMRLSYLRAYHWRCLPPELKEFQERDERSILLAAQKPF